MNFLKKIFDPENWVPQPLIRAKKNIGFRRAFRMVLTIGFNYIHIFFYLLFKRGLRAAYVFLWVKLFTPVGPGGAGFVYFFLGWLYRKYPLALVKMPRQFEIEITTVCNKRCPQCEHTYWTKESQPQQHMSFEEFETVFRQLKGVKWISLVGEGSPFLNKDIMKMFELIKSRDVFTYTPDHFDELTDEQIEQFVKWGLDGFEISLEGATQETYEKIKAGCKLENVTRNIKRLIEYKKKYRSPIPEIVFAYIIMKDTYKEIPQFLDLIRSLGTRRDFGAGSRTSFFRLLTFKQNEHLQIPELPKEIIAEANRKAQEHDLFINITSSNTRADYPSPKCCMAYHEPYIMMGGHVLQCCAVFMTNNRIFLRQNAFGNVFEKDFREIWDSRPYRILRSYINNPEKPVPWQCAGCRIFDTKPRELKYGIINTFTEKIVSREEFIEKYLGENVKNTMD